MADELLTTLREAIERLERRYRTYVRVHPGARPLRGTWTLSARTLRWHIVFESEVLEPDVDLEIIEDAIVVRACSSRFDTPDLVGVLPVPSGFDVLHPRVRFEPEYLEIRVFRTFTEDAS